MRRLPESERAETGIGSSLGIRCAFGSAPVRSDATRVQQMHREPLPTKGFKRSRRSSSDASLRETELNIGR